ncbi:MAG: Mobile element protein, partial [Olavius algarvensis Gamma 1 endosymbiont]
RTNARICSPPLIAQPAGFTWKSSRISRQPPPAASSSA